jgi:hypothetical protein
MSEGQVVDGSQASLLCCLLRSCLHDGLLSDGLADRPRGTKDSFLDSFSEHCRVR